MRGDWRRNWTRPRDGRSRLQAPSFVTRLVHRPLMVLTAWIAIVVLAGTFSSRLAHVLRGGTDPIAGSASEHVTLEVERAFGEGSLYQYLIVLSAPDVGIGDQRFRDAAARLTEALGMLPLVRSVETPWNTPRPELFGRGGHTALIVVTPRVNAYLEAERFNAGLRRAIAAAHVARPFAVQVTGTTAAIHAMDVASSSDLLAAERVGLPLTLIILLVVFGAPLAALLPVVLALIAVSIGFAGLYALHGWTPVTVFAENVVSMIGLGVGVDYALFVVSRYREESQRGLTPEQAAAAAAHTAGHSVLFSGATVMVGFLALFLVRAPFLHTIAMGGVFVVAAAVAASLTLLPAVLVMLGPSLMWPRKPRAISAGARRRGGFWPAWVGAVMKRPWLALAAAGVVLAVFIIPVARLRSWNIGAAHLPLNDEARQGYETLAQDFPRGWMSPIVVLIEAPEGHAVWEPRARAAIGALAAQARAGQEERHGARRASGAALARSAGAKGSGGRIAGTSARQHARAGAHRRGQGGERGWANCDARAHDAGAARRSRDHRVRAAPARAGVAGAAERRAQGAMGWLRGGAQRLRS